jgi:hypothetical protein
MAAFVTQPQMEEFVVYMNMEHGIWMKYPSTWQMLEDAGANAFMVVFSAPAESPSDSFRENVNIVVEKLAAPATLEQIVAATRQLLLQQMQVTFVEDAVRDRIGDVAAYRSVYTGAMMDRALKWQQYAALKGNRSYTFTYTAEPNKFESYLETVRRMIASLEIG